MDTHTKEELESYTSVLFYKFYDEEHAVDDAASRVLGELEPHLEEEGTRLLIFQKLLELIRPYHTESVGILESEIRKISPRDIEVI